MKLISYLRVSTDRQGRSGLGLEAQRAAVVYYAKQSGGEVVAEYIEVESGKRCDRKELAKALAQCRRIGARLVIAKLDRLARNVAFIANLMESNVDFVCCDRPGADRFQLHIEAALSEEEGRRISQRTKDALAAAKARGQQLGAHNPRCRSLDDVQRSKGRERQRQDAIARIAHILPQMQTWKREGFSLAAIAAKLNDAGYTTAKGAAWSAVQVSRALQRAGV